MGEEHCVQELHTQCEADPVVLAGKQVVCIVDHCQCMCNGWSMSWCLYDGWMISQGCVCVVSFDQHHFVFS